MPTRSKALLAIPNFSVDRDVGTLLNEQEHAFDISPVQSLEAVLERLASESFDVVLLSLSVLESSLNGLDEVKDAAPDAAILVLASRQEQSEALEAIRHGADDCIFLDDSPAHALRQTVFNVIHRKQLLREIVTAGYEDSTTGLYNLDGFKSMAQRLFDSCRQPRSKVYIVAFRVQGTAQNVLTGVTEALRATCRKSEIMPEPSLSRVGVEEFALLASADSLAEVQHLLRRCEETFQKHTPKNSDESPWSIEFGVAAYDPEYPATPAVVLERAQQNWQTFAPVQPDPVRPSV
jgi:PleD family two-component response regulator